jgi:hypothetical protein
MSKFHLVSSGVIVAKVMRDFNPTNNGWQIDAIEWIADAINEMQLKSAYIPVCKEVEVQNYRAKIPCDLKYFAGIAYDNQRLSPLNPEIPIQAAYNEFEKFNNLDVDSANHFQINPDFLHFNFKEGTISIYYWSIPVDKMGYPLVPNDGLIHEAISWWVLYKYLIRGGQHPNLKWDTAFAMWREYSPKARNRAKRITFADMEKLKRSHLTIIPIVRHEYDYYSFLQYYEDQPDEGVYLGSFRENIDN